MPLDPSDTPQFYTQELSDALNEQSGRITSFGGLVPKGDGAIATVSLLEGETLQVSLTLKGYTVCKVGCLP
jgi:hypothetical protein